MNHTQPIQARTRTFSTGENVQKWTRFYLLFFSDASEGRVENTRVHFWTFSPVSFKLKKLSCQIVGESEMWVGSRSCRYQGRADIVLYGNQEGKN